MNPSIGWLIGLSTVREIILYLTRPYLKGQKEGKLQTVAKCIKCLMLNIDECDLLIMDMIRNITLTTVDRRNVRAACAVDNIRSKA